ncbi:ATP-binding protein [Streptomyces sp. NPDC001941]|uniref:ATP-binding protein n=1 Tax=Streptomyces sp. NPDC001941 TaxID=3154659 RepID=UPI003318963B
MTPPAAPAPETTCRMVIAMQATRAAVPCARQTLRAGLRHWALPRDLTADVLLAASEVLANAVVHGCALAGPASEVTLTASRVGRSVRVEVHDPSPVLPLAKPVRVGDDAEEGRGLALVSAFTDRWGVKLDADRAGKTVWLEADLPAPAATAAASASVPSAGQSGGLR